MLLNQTIEATETTDNLLTNSDFEDGTAGWILSDDGVRIDGPYKDAGDSKIIRFRGQGSTISQLVNLTAVEEGKEILSYTISYHGYGCGNDANGHCTQENHDKIITNISFTDGSNTEVSSYTNEVKFEDGFTHHTFTKSINDTFLTGEVAINFELTGEDSYTGNNWLAPITDNLEFAITYQDYVQEVVVVQPIVVIEPVVVIEPIAVIETMVGGLELSNEITLDLIKDIQMMPEIEMIEMPMDMQPIEINMDMPEMEMNVEMPENNVTDNMQVQEMPDIIDIPQTREIRIEMPSDLPEIAEVKPIEEIKEIKVEGPSEPEPQVVEAEPEVSKQEAPERKAEISSEKNERSNVSNNTVKEKEISNEEKTSEKKISKSKEKSEKPKQTTNVKDEDGSKNIKSKSNSKEVPSQVVKTPTTPTLTLPLEYLQVLQDTIIMYETIDMRQEQIYGGQQEYNLNTGSITVANLDNNSSSRWSNLQDVRKRFKAPSYSRKSKKIQGN